MLQNNAQLKSLIDKLIHNSTHQDPGRTHNMGIAKMQADESCVSTVVILLGGVYPA